MDDNKTCSRCGEPKPRFMFYKSKGTRDGLQSHCKPCDNHRCTLRLRARSRLEVAAGTKRERTLTLVARELREQGLKRCPCCKVTKTLESFYENKGAFDGRAPHCIICVGANWNPSHRTVITEERRRSNREKVLRRQFGITLAEYQAMHDSQGGLCAICGMPETGKTLAVDHDHATGKVRELLCGRCNPAVGFLRESPELAMRLADYLIKHR